MITTTEQRTSRHSPTFEQIDLQESQAMAFVNEYVSAEDKARIDWAAIPHPHYLDPRIRIDPRRWVIDRDRDVFLMWTGKGRDEAANQHDFLFWWKGVPMALRMREEWSDKNTLTWQLRSLDSPAHLSDEHDSMIKALKEALKVYGGGFAPDLGIGSVEVQFDF